MPHPFSRYRYRLFQDFVRILCLPSLVFAAGLCLTDTRLGLLTPPAYVLWLFVAGNARTRYTSYMHRRAAHRQGGRLPTEVVGKWPGNLDVLIKLGKNAPTMYPGGYYLSLFEEYQTTTLNLRLLWSDLIISMDEELIKYILATGFNHFWRGVRQKERLETFLGDGIFNRDDEDWKKHRALARPFFAKDRISDFELFEKYSLSTLVILRSISNSDTPVDCQDLYARFSLDSASEFLFGEQMDTLQGPLPVAGKAEMSIKGTVSNDSFGSFARAFEASQEIVSRRAIRGYFWPVKELLKDEAVPHAQVLSDFIEPIVQRTLANKRKMQAAGMRPSSEHDTFLEYLADNTEDPKVIRDQLLNILLAGRDTTSCLLTFVTYVMATNPDIAQRMRAEVLEHCGPTGAPTIEKIKALRYMHAVINETLRVFPPVPINVRETRADGAILPPSDPTYRSSKEDGDLPVYLPGGTMVMYIPILTQKNPALWGPDAEVFDPDRWLDERLSRFTENPMMYTPFSGGPRICIGQNYARNEASYFLVRLLQEFDTFSLAPEAQPQGSLPPPSWKEGRGRERIEKIWPAYAMTLFVKGGLWVRFKKSGDV